MLSFQFLRMIQVTSASAENGSPHGAPPEGGGRRERRHCRSTGARGSVCLHAPPLPLRIIHQLFMRLYTTVVVCLCVTVMVCDRMITPFSPQLRGVSRLHSSPCTATPPLRGATCSHICQSLFPVGNNVPLHLRLRPPAPSTHPACLSI